MGVSVRVSRNVRWYVPWAVAIPAYLIIGMAYVVVAVVVALWWLVFVLPGKAITAWRDTETASERAARLEARQERSERCQEAYRARGEQSAAKLAAARQERTKREVRLSWPGYGIIAAVVMLISGIVFAGIAGSNTGSAAGAAAGFLGIAAIGTAGVCIPAAIWRAIQRRRQPALSEDRQHKEGP